MQTKAQKMAELAHRAHTALAPVSSKWSVEKGFVPSKWLDSRYLKKLQKETLNFNSNLIVTINPAHLLRVAYSHMRILI